MKENYEEILHENSTIITERLKLRRFTIDDAEDVYIYANDDLTVKYLTWSGVSTLEDARKVINNFYSRDGVYAIEFKETGRCIGCFSLNLIPEHEKADFGYILNREYWNHGYMTETLSAILQFCFEKLELNRVEAIHYAGNKGSGKVMEKGGMKKEGYALQEVKIKGVFHDVYHYGITKAEWLNRMS